jgi:hypothetical protein
VPSGYESPRVPLPKKMCFGDSAPNNQARGEGGPQVRLPQASAPAVARRVPTEGGLPEVHRRTLTSRIVLTREDPLTKRQPGGGVGCTARPNGAFGKKTGRRIALAGLVAFAIGFVCSKITQEMTMRRRPLAVLDYARLLSADVGLISLPEAYGGSYDD